MKVKPGASPLPAAGQASTKAGSPPPFSGAVTSAYSGESGGMLKSPSRTAFSGIGGSGAPADQSRSLMTPGPVQAPPSSGAARTMASRCSI